MCRATVQQALILLFAFVICANGQVTTPNANPTFTAGADVSVEEDSGLYSTQWATTISDGEGWMGQNGNKQSLTFKLVPDDPSLFQQGPVIDSSGILSFTPAKDAFGSTTVAVTLYDDGTKTCVIGNNIDECPDDCQPADCSASVTVNLQINIRSVNDCPYFSTRGDQTVSEDSGQSIVTGWAYDVSQGAVNEDDQKISWTVTNNNNALFSQQPKVEWSSTNPTVATLMFTPGENQFGTASVTVVAKDDGGSAKAQECDTSTSSTFSITVNPKNDRPSFTMGTTPVTVEEDSGTASKAGWATNIKPGPSNENSQTLSYNLEFVDPSAKSLFKVLPAIDPTTGTLTFTPNDNANTFGQSVQLRVQLVDSGGESPHDVSCYPINTCPILEIVITPINDAPLFTPGGDIIVWEDLKNYDIPPVPPVFSDGNQWATSISTGASNEGVGTSYEGQDVEFVVSNTNTGLFDVQPAIDSRGTLTFQLKKHANGVATVTATIKDTGNPPKTGNTATFTITVQSVNDPPTWDIVYSNPINVKEDAGLQDISIWASNVRRGGGNDERTQQLSAYAEPEDPSFFIVQPTIQLTDSGTGRLQYQVAPDKWGTTTVHVYVKDNGGVERNGVDFFTRDLIITVAAMNDPPTFKFADSIVTVVESNSPVSYNRGGFAMNITSGPGEDHPSTSVIVGQNVKFICSNNYESLFATQPKISSEGALSFLPGADQFGDAIVTCYAEDDHVPPEKSKSSTFTIRIQSKNNPPTFTLGPDIVGRQVTMCMTSGACTRTFANFLSDVAAGPSNEASQRVTFTTTVPPQFASLFTSLPSVDALTGSLSFTLALNKHTETGNPVVVTVKAVDDGGTTNGGTDTTVKTFKLEIQPVNTPPLFTAGPDVEAKEDVGLVQKIAWAKDVKKSVTDTSTAGLVFALKVADTTLFSQQPAISIDSGATGTLSFIPAPNKFGSTLVQVSLDNPEIGQNSDQFTITITITGVNDPPAFTPGSDVQVVEGSGAQVFLKWAKGISAGPYETSQILTFTVSCDKTSMFSVQPTLNTQGDFKFTLASGQSGIAQCTAQSKDNGGVLNGGTDTFTEPFTIHVASKNDAPSFVIGSDVSVLEGSGDYAAAGWATAISGGEGDENEVLTFVVSVDHPEYFEVQPKVNAQTGGLSFTLNKDSNGVATASINLNDNGPSTPPHVSQSNTYSFRIVIKPVNTAPTFNLGANIIVLENSGVYRHDKWSTGISAGPSNEASQSLRFTLTPANEDLFELPPVVDPATGDLMFSIAEDESGVSSISICLQDNGGTDNGGVDETCKTLSVSVIAVNDAPTAIMPELVTVLEDAGPVKLSNFLTGVSGGPDGEGQQQITQIRATVKEADKAAFSVLPAISLTTYELSFNTKKDFFGDVVVTVTVTDNGGTTNGGVNEKIATFTISVLAVNDQPTYTKGPNVEVLEDSAPYNALWATNISPGPANEAAQSLTFSLMAGNTQLFTVQPKISAKGYLSFTPAQHANGQTDITLTLQDNGGVDNGGVDVSIQQSFTISIGAVNDAPTFTAGADITIMEDAGPYVAKAWATNIHSGPDDEHLAQQANLQFNVTPAVSSFFAVQPQIQLPSGDLSFTVAPNRFGTTTISISLRDMGGTTDGGVAISAVRLLTLYVMPVNDAPVFTCQGDVSVLEDAGDQVVKDWIQNVSPGQFEEAEQSVVFSVSISDSTKFVSPPRIVGRDLLYTTAGDANGVLTLTVNASDRGGNSNGGISFVAQQYTFTIVPVNDAPTFTLGSDVVINENSGTTTLDGWLPTLAPGPPDESTQLLTAHMTLEPTGIMANTPLIERETRSLKLKVKPHAFGTVSASLYFTDNGGTTNGGKDASEPKTFSITVNAVNDPPTFNSGSPVIVVSSSQGLFSAQWATNISAGPGETDQTVAFSVSAGNPLLFTSTGQPAMSQLGVLTFVVRPGSSGNTTLKVKLRDSEDAVSREATVQVIVEPFYGTDTIVVTLNGVYESFNVENFKIAVASAMGVQKDQVYVRSVTPASVRIEFQLIGSPGGASSAQLTNDFVSRASDPSNTLRIQMGILAISVVPAGASPTNIIAYSTIPSATVAASSTSFSWVALAVGLFAGIVFIVLVVYLILSWRRRREDQKAQYSNEPVALEEGNRSVPSFQHEPVATTMDGSGPTFVAKPQPVQTREVAIYEHPSYLTNRTASPRYHYSTQRVSPPYAPYTTPTHETTSFVRPPPPFSRPVPIRRSTS